MITTLKEDDGRIICYAEWRLVGRSGFDVQHGEYVWIQDLWVHRDFERTKRINRIIDEIIRVAPSAKYCYFKRGKYGDRMKMFSKEQLERRRVQYEKVAV